MSSFSKTPNQAQGWAPDLEIKTMKKRLTKDQKKARDAYNFALRQEDRYLGSVFVTPQGQRDIEAKTRAAYEACKRLGMDHTHGL